jgi:hypothetical protein
MTNHGDMLSMPVCHLGGFFGFLGWPILARRRRAMNTSTTPMRILMAIPASDGAVLDFGGLLPVARMVRATTAARESSQPKMKAAPLRTPPLDIRTSMKAVRGIGSRVMTRPMRIRSSVTASPRESGAAGRRGDQLPSDQSLLWRNFFTKTTTTKMATRANTMPPT